MQKSTLDLIAIAKSGGGLRINASLYSTLDLISIAKAMQDKAYLFVYNMESKATLDLISIAKIGGSRVIFEQ